MAKIAVAPLVGAWIEITLEELVETQEMVAPLVGAWIEIFELSGLTEMMTVAPLVGAWIEICCRRKKSLRISRRSPRGSVD